MAKETFNRDKPSLGLDPPPPPPPDGNGLTGVTTAGVLTELKFTFTTTDSAGSYYAVYATVGQSTGIVSPAKQSFRLIAAIENNGLAGELDILTPYNAKFANAEAGSVIFVRLLYINSNSGQRWNLGQWKAVVTGT